MNTQVFTGVLVVETCCKCHMPFGMTKDFNDECLRDNEKYFFCPNGHSQHYTEGAVQRLQKQLEAEQRYKKWAQDDAQRARERATTIERSRRAIKGVLTRTAKRVAAGVCPCCKRSFQSVSRHMAHQHPDYVKNHEAEHQ